MKKQKCCYCGNETKNGKLFHKMCLIDDIYRTIYEGKRITKNLYCRCKDSGISIKEIRADVEEDKIGYKESISPVFYPRHVGHGGTTLAV